MSYIARASGYYGQGARYQPHMQPIQYYPAYHQRPMVPIVVQNDGGGGYWSVGKGVGLSHDYGAAINALALISFLFFINLLQTQLSGLVGQTLVVTVGTGTNNGTNFGRRRRRRDLDQDLWGQDFSIINNGEYFARVQDEFWINEEMIEGEEDDESIIGPDSGAGKKPITDYDIQWQNIMKDFLLKSSGDLKLPSNFMELFYRCRNVVACNIHQLSPPHNSILSVFTGPDHQECELLTEVKGECQNLSKIITNIIKNKQNQQHDPRDF